VLGLLLGALNGAQKLIGGILQAHHSGFASFQFGSQILELLELGLQHGALLGKIDGLGRLDVLLRALQPIHQLIDGLMELTVAHQGGLEETLPFGGIDAHIVPALIIRLQTRSQLSGLFGVQSVRGQMVTDHIQGRYDGLVTLQIQEELSVILGDILQQLDIRGRS